MKNYQETDEFEQEFESLKTKFNMSAEERNEIQIKLNKNIDVADVHQAERKKGIPFMYYTALSLAGLLFLLLAGPSFFQQGERNVPSELNTGVTHNFGKEDDETNENENPDVEVRNALSVLKEEFRLGISQDEVGRLLGTDYAKVLSAMNNEKQWRYDIGTKEGYHYSEQHDFADMDGLQNGDVKMQIWVTWDEESKVKSYSSIYVNPDDGKLYEYRVFPDGTERNMPFDGYEVNPPEENEPEVNPDEDPAAEENNNNNTSIDQEQAIEISSELLTGLRETFKQLGEEHKWSSVDFPGYTKPNYSVAKPDLLNFATDEFSDGTLQEILMDFYCHCDKFSLPGFDFHIRSEIVESNENQFVIKSISLVNMLGHGGYTGYLTVANENGNWKIDNWELVSFLVEPINLTPDEYIKYRDGEGAGDKITYIETVQMPSSDEGVDSEIDVHVFHSQLGDNYFGVEENSTKVVRVDHIEKYNNH
ncbi:hypothetical protein SAMN05877753_102582 [Bacillus oleivorans]|uniref:Uncharacterized protein n=1 Tax=Bacillus oleivorans TaxID=1448271 RepID=A0A285CLT8_9BACI|nr:hypothetical protein [Bacillus oleivorans]SNX68539.1 hypothetical protein SAMN05877753_102582 [Bacillus oleivorans]